MLGEWMRRVWYLLNRGRMERELAREMEAHREMAGKGGAPFGNALRLREESADVWGWRWLDQAGQDLKFTVRTLKPEFALTVGVVLSLGIGVNLALFQMMNLALWKVPAVKDPASFVQFRRFSETMRSSGVPYPVTEFVAGHNRTLAGVMARVRTEVAWGDDATDRVRASFVSGNWFREMGGSLAMGRGLSALVDEKPDAAPAAVLSYDAWKRRTGGDLDVLGKTIRLNDQPVLVVGVASEHFPALQQEITDVFLPVRQYWYFHPGTDFLTAWETNNTEIFGRVKPGVALAAVREDMRVTMAEVARMRPVEFSKGEWLEPYSALQLFRTPEEKRRGMTVFFLLGLLTLLVLLVACSNVGNLLLSRAAGRSREIGVRIAMGASRWRIVRQLLMESAVLAVLGAAGGVLFGWWAAEFIGARIELPPQVSFEPDVRTAMAAAAIALFTMIAVGLAPAWRVSRHDLSGAMKDGGQQNSGGLERTRLRKVLLAAQVAASCLLLVIAGLMVEGARRLMVDDHGFSYSNVAAMNPGLGRYGMKGAEARRWWDGVREAVTNLPETEAVALVSHQPLGGGQSVSNYNDARGIHVTSLAVDEPFFQVMGIRLLTGRNFARGDDARKTIIIGRRLAQAMYGTEDVVGRGFPKAEPERTIVGVTADAALIKIQANNVSEQYEPLDPERYAGYVMVAKARTDAGRLVGPMRTAARAADHRVLATAVTLAGEMDRRMDSMRLASAVFGGTALAALALACIGIYGVVSFSVTMRTKEIGIRVALGSPRKAITALLCREQVWPLAMGMAIGLAGAYGMSRTMQGEPIYLHEMGAAIPLLVTALFCATGGLAILAPARRALRMDPLRALRHE